MQERLPGMALATATLASTPALAATVWTAAGSGTELAGACSYGFDGLPCSCLAYCAAAANVTTGRD